MQGRLELMLGPMRSNKTAELLRRAEHFILPGHPH